MAYNVTELMNQSAGINTIGQYFQAALIFICAFLILRLTTYVILKILDKHNIKQKEENKSVVQKILESLKFPFFLIVSAYLSTKFIERTETIDKIMDYLLIIFIVIYVIKAIGAIIDLGIKRALAKKEREEGETDPTVMNLFGKFLKGVFWFLGFLFLLSTFGVNVTSMIAGLGIAGIAIAFALQNILADIFASVSIHLDKPFKAGDFISIGSDSGTVQKIGIKSTRIKTLQGEEMIVSNKELTETRVRNFKNMQRRRIAFNIGVKYDTPRKKIEKIPGMIKKIIEKNKEIVEFSRCHFADLGTSSLNFEIVYFINSKEFTLYRDIQQKINLEIMAVFEKEGIEMAFPTQTILVEQSKKARKQKKRR